MAATALAPGDTVGEQDGQDLTALCNRFLPLIAEHERWPHEQVEHLMHTGEAIRIAVVLAELMQKYSLSEAQLEDRIASGEVSQLLQAMNAATKPNADPTSELMKAIAEGRRVLDPILEALEPFLHGDAKGFAVDLASGSTFFPQNFARRWPRLKVYSSDHSAEKHNLTGTAFMEWCLQQFAESPARDFEELARRGVERRTAEDGAVQVNLLDALWHPGKPPWPSEEDDSRISCELWDRAVDVDVATERWVELEHLRGACRLVSCTSLMVQVGYRDPDAWRGMVRNASTLLAEGGVLLLYDTTRWGSYLERASMEKFLADEGLPLDVVSHSSAASSAAGEGSSQSDAGGRLPEHMALEVLRKRPGDHQQSHQDGGDEPDLGAAACQRAATLREEGNRCFSAKSGRNVPKAVRCYAKALDAVAAASALGGFSSVSSHREMASRLESNLSAALLEMGRAEEALLAADRAIHWDPDWKKAHFRRERALAALGRVEDLLAAHAVSSQLPEPQAPQAPQAPAPAPQAAAAPAAAPPQEAAAAAPATVAAAGGSSEAEQEPDAEVMARSGGAAPLLSAAGGGDSTGGGRGLLLGGCLAGCLPAGALQGLRRRS